MHNYRNFWLLFLLWLAGMDLSATSAAERFVGVLADGRTIQGKQIFDWYNDQVRPRLDGQALLDPNNPVMWLRDREVSQGPEPTAFVEMICGDRLPGTVREYLTGTEQANLTHPPHVVVEPGFDQRPAREDPDMTVRVSTEFIRRVVWRKRARDTYEPNHVFLRDGGSLAFRAVRLSSSSVTLLTDAGPRRYSFSEIAELHFPPHDAWESHLNELAVLSTGETARMMQVETNDGLIATASLSRMLVLGHGGPDRYDFWIHAVQPAWSLDPLWVPCGNIIIRRFFALNEVPLYRLRALAFTHGSAFGAEHDLKRNRNALEGLARSGDYEAGWGFGVQGAGEIVLGLHRAVRQLRGRVGLDQLVGSGGCIRALAYVGRDSGSPVWQSPHIVGSQTSVSLGTIGLNPDAGNNQTHALRLAIDAAHDGRPAGSDPWEIRDVANWLDPLLVLDETVLREELRQRLPSRIAAWTGWRVMPARADSLEAATTFSSIYPPMGEYRTLTQIKPEQPLRLLSTISLTAETNWLVVQAVHRTHVDPAAVVEVRIGGELAGAFKAPLFDPSHRDPEPLIIPLADYRKNGAESIDVEITRKHAGQPLDWRAISVVNRMPLLATLFEDQGDFQTVTEGIPLVAAEIEKGDRHAGTASVKVASGQTVRLRLPQPLEVRSNPEWGQYRYLRFAFRKQGGGRVAIELDRPLGEERAARYDAGQGEPVGGQANRVWTLELPDQWIVMTRDLVSEFGEFNAEALTLTVPDGGQALFDHVYLARSEKDFKLTPATIAPELANQMARRELAAEVLKRALPAVVKLVMPDGRTGTGTIIDPDGNILTTAHLLVQPNLDVMVFLADGSQHNGKSLGIDRENDLGMVKLEGKGPFPELDIEDNKTLPDDQMYIGAIYQPEAEDGSEPLTHVVGIRRVVEDLIWTDFDAPDWTAGGPLLNRDSRIVGIMTSRSRFGGFQFLIGSSVRKNIDRLKRSEVWGEWQSGSGPMVGLVIRTVSEGCRVIEIFPDSPAAAAGLQIDDYVISIENQPVSSLGEIYGYLKAKNPGDGVKVGYLRGNQQLETTMTLTPRWP